MYPPRYRLITKCALSGQIPAKPQDLKCYQIYVYHTKNIMLHLGTKSSSCTYIKMKGSPCCAGLMRSCRHTSAKYGGVINQLWGGGHQPSMGGSSTNYGGGASAKYGGVINQLWGGHQPSMGGVINQLWGGISQLWGGAISQLWGGHQPTMGGGGIFPPVCTGSQNRENYFSNTYVLPSVNRTAGPINKRLDVSVHINIKANITVFCNDHI